MSRIKNKVSPRWAKFCGWALRRMGWTSASGPVPDKKAILIGVPHTSFYDFLVCYLFYTQFEKVPHIMIKKELFFWPLGPILRACGAVPIDRSSPGAMVKSLIRLMENEEEFHLALAPEGTRKAVRKWKTGFHMIAKETGASVWLGYFDWGKKEITVGERFEISDNARADMDRIQAHYRGLGLVGKHKDGFVTE